VTVGPREAGDTVYWLSSWVLQLHHSRKRRVPVQHVHKVPEREVE